MLETEPIELVGTLNVGKVEKGTNNYDDLINKPVINDIQLDGNLSSADLGLQPAGSYVENETDPVFSASPSAGITNQDITNWNNKSDFSGNYNDLTNKPDLSQFITKSVNDLTNYYLKSETYTQSEVNSLIGAIQQFHYEIVQELPTTGATNIIYLVPKSTSQTNNVYDEYVYANNNWEKIGDTQIDLSNYVTTSDLNTALASYTTTTDLTTLLSGKQDTLVSGTNIKTINNNSILGSGNINVSSPKGAYTITGTLNAYTPTKEQLTTVLNEMINAGETYIQPIFIINNGSSNTYSGYKNTAVLIPAGYGSERDTLRSSSSFILRGFALYGNFVLNNKNVIPYVYGYANINKTYNSSTGTVTVTTVGNGISQQILTDANMSDFVLAKNNTTAFTPTGDYNPATKKYVDDLVGNISTVLESLVTVSGGE